MLHSINEMIAQVLQQVAQTAETAIETSLANHDDIRYLQTWAKERILLLEHCPREKFLKFRGFPEIIEKDTELTAFLASWLGETVDFADGMEPVLTRAYRLGNPNSDKRKGPRDIIAEFLDFKNKNKVLQEVKKSGSLRYNNETINVFPGVSPEALQIRRALKPITSQLTEHEFKYRWAATGYLQVRHKGTLHQAADIKAGTAILVTLGIQPNEEMETSATDRKRKRPNQATPPHWNKPTVRRRVFP